MTDERIRLTLPAQPGYIRLARLTAAGLASRLGFTYDEVEDLRIAVDELCYLLLGAGQTTGQVTLVFNTEAPGLEVRGEGPSGPRRGEFAELSEQILKAIVDDYEIGDGGRTVRFRMAHRP